MMNVDVAIEELKNFTANAESRKWEFYKEYPYSVSKILNHLKKPFDKEDVAKKTHNKHFNNPESVYYGKSVDEILHMWEEKAETGRNNGKTLDDFIGLILDDNASDEELERYIGQLRDKAKHKCEAYRRFYMSSINNKIEFLCREQILALPETGVNGRLDAMFRYNDSILLIDWKNTEKIESSNRFEKMLGPLYEYDACDLNSYTMQVYI